MSKTINVEVGYRSWTVNNLNKTTSKFFLVSFGKHSVMDYF